MPGINDGLPLSRTQRTVRKQMGAVAKKAEVADQLAAAVREWLRAKQFRENMPVPFGATPLTHPEVFNNALGSAKEANRLLQEALDAYDALVTGEKDE